MISIMIGVSGSGKSTYCNKLRQRICSTDRFIDTYAMALGVKYGESFDQIQLLGLFGELNNRFNSDIEDAIMNDEDFIIDRTNLTIDSRNNLIIRLRDLAEKHGKQIIIKGVVFNPSRKKIMEQLIKREQEEGKKIPQDVILNQLNSFELPTIEEGFDVLEQIHE